MQKKQNISFLSCWHSGKGRAKVGRELLNRQRIRHKGTDTMTGTLKFYFWPGGGVKPKES
jgi:hypothetical protein